MKNGFNEYINVLEKLSEISSIQHKLLQKIRNLDQFDDNRFLYVIAARDLITTARPMIDRINQINSEIGDVLKNDNDDKFSPETRKCYVETLQLTATIEKIVTDFELILKIEKE